MEKKQMQTIFFYEFKLGHRAAEVTRNINSAFSQGTVNECMVQRWFQKFCDGDESLEDEEGRGCPSVDDNDEMKVLVKTDLRTTVRKLAEELGVSHPTVLDHLKQLGKSNKLDKWVPHELRIERNIFFITIL